MPKILSIEMSSRVRETRIDRTEACTDYHTFTYIYVLWIILEEYITKLFD